MSVETPTIPAYYFECSFGKTRLTYFIPPAHLKQMVADDKIRSSVLEDFPDGVDLDCTEADFEDFNACYGFRPDFNAQLLRDSFFSMYSTTRDWKSFHGTGFVKADEVERNVTTVRSKLASEDLMPATTIKSVGLGSDFVERRNRFQEQMQKQVKIDEVLINLQVSEVDANKSIRQQPFAQVPMSGEKPAAEVFQKLHQKQSK